MHVRQVLSRWLRNRAAIAHQARSDAVLRVVQALIVGGKAALTALGRCREGGAHVKHHIKAVDRLLGNRHLHAEQRQVYRSIARALLVSNKRPILLVDWSDIESGKERQWAMIKAAIPVGGRAIVIFARVFPFKRYNSPSAHREFLKGLETVLPAESRPILITDAGFRGPWFRAVEALGWDWVGRVRNGIKYFNDVTQRWRLATSLYREATPTARFVGDVLLSPRHRYRFRLYLVRAYPKAVGGRHRCDHRNANANLHRKLHRAPWLLATSLPHEPGSARRIKKLYASRMQIEETIRDVKSHRWGSGLRYTRSRSPARLEVLVLLAALAALALWLVGLAGRELNLDRHLQANTERRRNVLSVPFVGRQLFLRAAVAAIPIAHRMFARLRGLAFLPEFA